MSIKYLGSKRTLVPTLGAIAAAIEARSALDLFTGTTRVAQEFKRRGCRVTAVDSATYAKVLADAYIATDSGTIDAAELADAIAALNALPGNPGYFTETFCERSRYLQPRNGARVDGIRDALEERYAASPLYPVLLTSLMEAADRVDSTTGLQMAYLKQWSARSHKELELRVPELLRGPGESVLGDAMTAARTHPRVDLAYLDPPYNHHRYTANYHVWETLVRWDAPKHYGIACKRADLREPDGRSAFNSKRTMPDALRDTIAQTDARVVVVSYNDEAWVTPEQIATWLAQAGHECVSTFGFDSKRYVGAQIGIHNQAGEKVGDVGRLRNVEYLVAGGTADALEAIRAIPQLAGAEVRVPTPLGVSP